MVIIRRWSHSGKAEHMDPDRSQESSTHTQQPSGHDSTQAQANGVTDSDRVPGPLGENTQLDRSFASEHLDELILAILLSHGEANGMEIIRECTRRFGVQFSPGTVYPHLHSLEEEGVLARRECVQTKEYRVDDPEAARARLTSVLSQLTCLESFLSGTGTEAEGTDDRLRG